MDIKNLIDFGVCREFGMFEVKVPVILIGIQGWTLYKFVLGIK